MVRKPVTSQAPISSAGEPPSREISAETMKMPEPIIEPITSIVPLVSPSPLTNSFSLEPIGMACGSVVGALVLKEPLSSKEGTARKTLHQLAQEFLCYFAG